MSGHFAPTEVSAAKAKTHLLRYLRRAERGHPTVISKRGTKVAALVPIEQFVRAQESAALFVRSLDAMLDRARQAPRAKKPKT